MFPHKSIPLFNAILLGALHSPLPALGLFVS
jgi:hypothetical protein